MHPLTKGCEAGKACCVLIKDDDGNYLENDRVMERAPLPSPPHADAAEDDDLLMDTPLSPKRPRSTRRQQPAKHANIAQHGSHGWLPCRPTHQLSPTTATHSTSHTTPLGLGDFIRQSTLLRGRHGWLTAARGFGFGARPARLT